MSILPDHLDILRSGVLVSPKDGELTVGGRYTDKYFLRTIDTMFMEKLDPDVTLQIFAKKEGIVVGIYESLRMLYEALDDLDLDRVRVEALPEASEINKGTEWEPVMKIHGPYRLFAHMETPILGVLARRSLVATNTRAAVEAARGKPIIFMGARHDDWRVQEGDGYAALVGGASSVSSDAGARWLRQKPVGTMPHAMIAAFGGDTVGATLAFARYVKEHEPDVPIVSLVDYHNDVINTSLAVAASMEEEYGKGSLFAVRVDTSEKMMDKCFELQGVKDDPEYRGVNLYLVNQLRSALDQHGHEEVGIVVSGGFTPKKIRFFEEQCVPITAYGVGSSLLGHNNGQDGLLTGFDFTADIVSLDGKPQSKVGREEKASDRLIPVDWNEI